MNIRKRTTTCSTDKFTESSLAMIIFGVQGIIFPLELFPRFILHRASSPFCSRYIFSSPLLVHLAVQGRNLLETSFLSTSSPLRLPFNLFLRPFLRLRFRSSRPSSSSWIFSPDLFLMHSNFFDLILSPSNLLYSLQTFFPDSIIIFLFLFISVHSPRFSLSTACHSENLTSFFLCISFYFLISLFCLRTTYALCYVQLVFYITSFFLGINFISIRLIFE